MNDNNDKLTMSKNNDNKNFDSKGKFVKGNTISRCKRNRTETDKLHQAIKKVSTKKNKDWWEHCIETAWDDSKLMATINNKLVSNKTEIDQEIKMPDVVVKKVFIQAPGKITD